MFLDLRLADEALLHLYRTLRRDPDLEEIPVVLLWRGDADEPTIQGLRLGVKDFLVKRNGADSEQAWSELPNRRHPFRCVQ